MISTGVRLGLGLDLGRRGSRGGTRRAPDEGRGHRRPGRRDAVGTRRGDVGDGGEDAAVAGAAAEHPGHVLGQRVPVVGPAGEQVVARHQHPGRAEPALQGVVVRERLLQRVLVARAAEALHRRDLRALALHREQQAGPRRLAVDEDRAHPAHAVLAADVGAGEAEPVAQHVGEGRAGCDGERRLEPVDGEGDVERGVGGDAHALGGGHATASAWARASSRAASTPSRRAR